ncbi:MAG: SPOR domain-containing protein, partial [Magnetococcales bacterium]|nr:SPOR domain-containing protein [Magnetococcales bacterium]
PPAPPPAVAKPATPATPPAAAKPATPATPPTAAKTAKPAASQSQQPAATPPKTTPAGPATGQAAASGGQDAITAWAKSSGEGATASARKEGKPPAAATPPGGSKYSVQLGSFSAADRADEVVKKLSGMRIQGRTMPTYKQESKVNGKSVYRVRLGPFMTRAMAEQAAQMARGSGLGLTPSIVGSGP